MNSAVGSIIIVKLFTNGILLSSGICALANKISEGLVENLISIIIIICFSLISILDLIVCCYSSELIENSMSRLCNAIEYYIITKPINVREYQMLLTVLGVKKTLKFNVLGLFNLKTVTVLVIFGYVFNYAVILIQTQ
jgi:hypothetical protein